VGVKGLTYPVSQIWKESTNLLSTAPATRPNLHEFNPPGSTSSIIIGQHSADRNPPPARTETMSNDSDSSTISSSHSPAVGRTWSLSPRRILGFEIKRERRNQERVEVVERGFQRSDLPHFSNLEEFTNIRSINSTTRSDPILDQSTQTETFSTTAGRYLADRNPPPARLETVSNVSDSSIISSSHSPVASRTLTLSPRRIIDSVFKRRPRKVEVIEEYHG
jgi:hypothetical protein